MLVDHGFNLGSTNSRIATFTNYAAGNIVLTAAAPGQTNDSFKVSSVTANRSTIPVPGPLAGEGMIPILGFGLFAMHRRKRRLAP